MPHHPSNVGLCPYRRLGDLNVAKKLFYLVEPKIRGPDPINRFEADHDLKRCSDCGTDFDFSVEGKRCTVKVSRNLGKGKNSQDSHWLAQYSKPGHGG